MLTSISRVYKDSVMLGKHFTCDGEKCTNGLCIAPWIRAFPGDIEIFLIYSFFFSLVPSLLYLVKQLPPEVELQLIPVAKYHVGNV